MEYMAKNKVPNVGVCNYTKEASAQWRTMSPEEKEVCLIPNYDQGCTWLKALQKYKLSPEEKAKANEAVKEYHRTPEYRRAVKMYKVKVKAPYKMNAYMRCVAHLSIVNTHTRIVISIDSSKSIMTLNLPSLSPIKGAILLRGGVHSANLTKTFVFFTSPLTFDRQANLV